MLYNNFLNWSAFTMNGSPACVFAGQETKAQRWSDLPNNIALVSSMAKVGLNHGSSNCKSSVCSTKLCSLVIIDPERTACREMSAYLSSCSLCHNHLLLICMWHECEKGDAKQLSPEQECPLSISGVLGIKGSMTKLGWETLSGFSKMNTCKYMNVLIMWPVFPSGKYRMWHSQTYLPSGTLFLQNSNY